MYPPTKKAYPLHLGMKRPNYIGLESNFFREKKYQGLTPMQKTYLSDHLSSKRDQETFGVARRSESKWDHSDDTARPYYISKRPTAKQRNHMRDYLSRFAGSSQPIRQL